MIIGDDKFDAVQATRLEPEQEIAPARLSRLASSTAST
jgi:hypothetical protein